MKMKINIVYDNRVKIAKKELKGGWGFSCYIQTERKNILFDTGWDGDVLVSNMRILGIDILSIDCLILSHSHVDHCGGLDQILQLNDKLKIYIPSSFSKSFKKKIKEKAEVYEIQKLKEIYTGIYTTGEIEGIMIKGTKQTIIKEQSLIISSTKGLVVITGCAHSGIEKILNSANKIGKIYALIGGYHYFEEYNLLKDIPVLVPTHCTKNKTKIFSLYPKNCQEGGVGYQLSI